MWFPESSTLSKFVPNANEIRLSSLKPTRFAYRWVMWLFDVEKMLLGISCTIESTNIMHLKSWADLSVVKAESLGTFRLVRMHELSLLQTNGGGKLIPKLSLSEQWISNTSVRAIWIKHDTKIQILKFRNLIRAQRIFNLMYKPHFVLSLCNNYTHQAVTQDWPKTERLRWTLIELCC